MLKRLAILTSTAGLVLAVACSQSDPGITTAVKSKLAADDTVKAYQIDVDTKSRVVTLSGAVETAAAKEQALLLARQTDGVQEVVDRITVDAQAAPTTGDLREGANEAGREIREESREATEKAKELGREAETRAGEAVDRTGAVMTDAAVTSAVKTKFLADTAVSGFKIDVDTRDGIVTLSGRVPTKAEADRAVAIARDTSGARSVVNNLSLGR